jgi:hypothetical protein
VHELKQNKPCYVEECFGFLDQRSTLTCCGYSIQNKKNVDNLNNIRRETSRHFSKKKEYRKDRFGEPETNSKITNIGGLYRDINNCKKIYQPRINMVNVVKDGMITDSQIILVRWRNNFSQMINVLYMELPI